VNVLKVSHLQIIQGFIKVGWTNRHISRVTGIHRDTVAKYRQELQNRPNVPTDVVACQVENPPNAPTDPPALPITKSDHIRPFTKEIWHKFTAGLTGQRIYQDLVEETGFAGSYDGVKRYLRKLGRIRPEGVEHLPALPGKEAQVDFGKGALVFKDGKYRWAWLFKMTLSFSGHSYEELVFHQDIETFLRCHENAFKAFGGVPETVKLDNLKAGVLSANLYEPDMNPAYLSFAVHWGFIPNPCMPGRPQHKGRVERDVGYTKSNALKGRKFNTLEDGNLFLRSWNKRWARTRIHGTKKCQVWKLFTDFEQKALRPLAERPFVSFKIGERKVDLYGHIEVQGNYYSVPHPYISERVQVHYNSQEIKVYQEQQLIAIHKASAGKGRFYTRPEHRPAYKSQSLEEAEGWQCKKAKEVGPNCHQLVYRMFSQPDDPMALRRSRGILSLSRRFAPAIVEQACGHALGRSIYRYRYVKQLCENMQETRQNPEPTLTQEHELIRSPREYQSLIEERNP
jgi:transposase